MPAPGSRGHRGNIDRRPGDNDAVVGEEQYVSCFQAGDNALTFGIVQREAVVVFIVSGTAIKLQRHLARRFDASAVHHCQ